jgi:hypothetical protein
VSRAVSVANHKLFRSLNKEDRVARWDFVKDAARLGEQTALTWGGGHSVLGPRSMPTQATTIKTVAIPNTHIYANMADQFDSAL